MIKQTDGVEYIIKMKKELEDIKDLDFCYPPGEQIKKKSDLSEKKIKTNE